MHRDVVTHVAVSVADFFITGSADGKNGLNTQCDFSFGLSCFRFSGKFFMNQLSCLC